MMQQQANAAGVTAFHVAAERGDVRALSLLLSNGADPMATDSEGQSGLHLLRLNFVGR